MCIRDRYMGSLIELNFQQNKKINHFCPSSMGFYLTTPNKDKSTSKNKTPKLSYVASSMQGWRTSMEDAHIAVLNFNQDPDLHLFGVFDGHGGKEVADYCQENFEQVLKSDPLVKTDIIQALKNTFKKIDEVLEKIGKDSYYSSGCTANVMFIQKDKIIIANVGDSRSILYQKTGKVIQLSEDHKPELPGELARIKKAGGEVFMGRVNGNLNLSRAVGDLEYKKNKSINYDEQLIISVPEITTRTISPDDDFILMGCDGVYELLTNEQLAQKIKELMDKKYKKEEIIEALLDEIIAPNTSNGSGCDNMSAIIVKLNSDQFN
eukprot:TRINITY_DN3328_c0_g1_i2.p1 TRINITY_DN3328_c0_g1~~TRINITY_DN3328_c0_g1_i2.p1  ORF type:complete len:321 (-),score=56.27 TRINITY_DN3328_c0_g1_i2:82-1044(-)